MMNGASRNFRSRPAISPKVERLLMSRIDEAFAKLKNGSPRYRIVLDNDF